MRIGIDVKKAAKQVNALDHINQQLSDTSFVERHKTTPSAFMRTRKLPFIVLFILILRSSVKSLQNVLNEFTLEQDKAFTITAGAFTKARKKLKHTAYIELNEDITEIYYRDDDIKRYRGYRLLAFDGSKIILPYSKEIVSEFGETPIKNGKEALLGSYASAMFQSCYDVLNHIAVSSTLSRGDAYEASRLGIRDVAIA